MGQGALPRQFDLNPFPVVSWRCRKENMADLHGRRSRSGAVRQLIGSITRRSQVRILPPQPWMGRGAVILAGLLNRYGLLVHRGFESRPIRWPLQEAPITFWRGSICVVRQWQPSGLQNRTRRFDSSTTCSCACSSAGQSASLIRMRSQVQALLRALGCGSRRRQCMPL